MVEKIPKPESTLPLRPASELLQLSETDFAEVAKNAGLEVDALRKILERNVARTEALKQVKTAEVPQKQEEDPNMVRAGAAIVRELGRILHKKISHDDISRDPKQAATLHEDGDAYIRWVDRQREIVSRKKIAGIELRARNLYKQSYLIQGAIQIDELIRSGISSEQAYKKLSDLFIEKREMVNLDAEREALYDAANFFFRLHRNSQLKEEITQIHANLSGDHPSKENRDILRVLTKATQAEFFRPGGGSRVLQEHDLQRFWQIIYYLIKPFRAAVYKKSAVDGPAEVYDTGQLGGSINYPKGPRPRRGTRDFPEDRS